MWGHLFRLRILVLGKWLLGLDLLLENLLLILLGILSCLAFRFFLLRHNLINLNMVWNVNVLLKVCCFVIFMRLILLDMLWTCPKFGVGKSSFFNFVYEAYIKWCYVDMINFRYRCWLVGYVVTATQKLDASELITLCVVLLKIEEWSLCYFNTGVRGRFVSVTGKKNRCVIKGY